MAKKHTDRYTPVSRIFVSSKVGRAPGLEQINTDALWKLHQAFKTIYNSNGEVTFGLTDLEEKIVTPADAYVFLPIPGKIKHLTAPVKKELFREAFKAASLHVGTQTKDPHLRLEEEDATAPLKPIVMINHNGCYDWFKELIHHMHTLGTIVKKLDNIYFPDTITEAIHILKTAHTQRKNHHSYHPGSHQSKKVRMSPEHDPNELHRPDFNVCVFCSASTRNKELIDLSRHLGSKIALQDWGAYYRYGMHWYDGWRGRGGCRRAEAIWQRLDRRFQPAAYY